MHLIEIIPRDNTLRSSLSLKNNTFEINFSKWRDPGNPFFVLLENQQTPDIISRRARYLKRGNWSSHWMWDSQNQHSVALRLQGPFREFWNKSYFIITNVENVLPKPALYRQDAHYPKVLRDGSSSKQFKIVTDTGTSCWWWSLLTI